MLGDSMNNEYQNNYQEYPQNSNNNEDKGSFGFAILGFIFPIIGLILYIIWKDKAIFVAFNSSLALKQIILLVSFIVINVL